VADFRAKPQKVTKVPDPSENPWFWNPNMVSVRKAPDWFLGPLKRTMGEELEVTWNPVNERWQVWTPAPRIQHPVCRGWRLLFIHNGPSGEHLPLDERVYARLWSCSADQHVDGRKYFQRIQDEYHRDEAKKQARLSQEAVDQAMPFWDHSQIKVAMRGKSNGSKFATYHA
jgi:hypothetical protein